MLFCSLALGAQAAVPAYRPADNTVVLRLPGNDATELSQLRQAIHTAPQDRDALTRYIGALIAAGQQSGQERYYGYAEQALNEAPNDAQRSLTLLKAQLLQHRHAFGDADALLNELLTREPRHRDARLMRAQVRLHLHKPEQAMRDCVVLMPQVDLLTSTTCFAQARAALGDVVRAYALVTTTLQSSVPDATRSWSAGVAAELATRLGDNEAADKSYRLSLSLDRQHHYPRIAYADWLLSQGRHSEALVIAREGTSSADQLRVVLAEHSAHSQAAQQLQLIWQEARLNGERTYLRDQARFELEVLHNTARAHVIALDNFSDHREAEDALLLHATATLVHDTRALQSVQAWSKERHYVDVRLDSGGSRT